LVLKIKDSLYKKRWVAKRAAKLKKALGKKKEPLGENVRPDWT